jgi:hypothetical protein
MAQDIFANSPEVDLRKRWALMQLQAGADSSPVHHPLQAVARALQGTMGGYLAGQAEADDKASSEQWVNSLLGATPSSPPAAAAPVAPQQAAPQAPASSQLPRGFRNNNPLNIEAGGFSQGQPGFAGSDGRFARFGSMDDGLAAANKLLDTYQNKYGLNTVGGIVNRWAPPKENDTRGYAASVAGRLGVSPDTPLTAEQRPALIQAMALMENGRPLPNAMPPGSVQVAQVGPHLPGSLPAAPGAGGPPSPAGPMQGGLPPAMPAPGVPAARSQLDIPPNIAAAARQMIQEQGSKARPAVQKLLEPYMKPVERVRPMSPAERQAWSVPEGVSAGINEVDGKPTFSQPSNSVNVNTAANPLHEIVAKQLGDQRKGAQTAATQTIPSIFEARKALDEGAITGAFAGPRKDLQKIGALFGLDASQASNTEVLGSAVGSGVLAHIKELGANPSNADRDYIEKVQGGQIALEEKSIRKILDIQEKYARNAIRNFNNDSKKLMSAPGGGEAFKTIAPLMSFDEPGPYVPPQKAPPGAAPAAAPSAPQKSNVNDLKKKYGLD